MAKRGRKPGAKRKGYFYEREEQAVVDYINSTDEEEKNKIYNEILHPVFSKMVESIINRYKLYPPDENFKETFDDTISFLLTKINHFDASKGYKSYSYCGTVCKNYLIYKINQFNKNRNRSEAYNESSGGLSDNIKFSYDDSESSESMLTELINKTVEGIRQTINDKEKNKLTDNQVIVGEALIELLTNWDEIFTQMGSNKYNKSSILLFLKERTLLTAKEIRDSMKIYKKQYYLFKNDLLSE